MNEKLYLDTLKQYQKWSKCPAQSNNITCNIVTLRRWWGVRVRMY